MTDFEKFTLAVKTIKDFQEKKNEQNEALEKAFGQDSTIMDFIGLDELMTMFKIVCSSLFPKISQQEIEENCEWYIWEVPNFNNSGAEIEDNGKIYKIVSDQDMFNYLNIVNSEN